MPKTLATATVDRLLHHAHIVLTEGTSLRLAEASAGRAHAVIFETFEHTTAQALWSSLGSRLRDGHRLLWLADALVAR